MRRKAGGNTNARGGSNANDYKPNISRPPNQDGYNDPPVKSGFSLGLNRTSITNFIHFLDTKATEWGRPIATGLMELTPSMGIANLYSYAKSGTTIFGESMNGVQAGLQIAGLGFGGLKLLKCLKGITPVLSQSSDYLTLYRGDLTASLIIKSHAAKIAGYAYSQSLIKNGNIVSLMKNHALDSSNPASPFISVTSNPAIARYFAGVNGTIHVLRIHKSRAIFNNFNNFVVPGIGKEAEYLVPNYIKFSEMVGK